MREEDLGKEEEDEEGEERGEEDHLGWGHLCLEEVEESWKQGH